MSFFQVGDDIRYIDTPSQTGVVQRMNPLGVIEAMVVVMNDGPMHTAGKLQAFFGAKCDDIETYTP